MIETSNTSKRADRRVRVENVLDPLHRRLLPQGELFSSGGWCGVRLSWSHGLPCRSSYAGCCGGHCDPRMRAGSAGRRSQPAVLHDYLPQQSFSPSATLMLSTPSTFLSVTRATPVS